MDSSIRSLIGWPKTSFHEQPLFGSRLNKAVSPCLQLFFSSHPLPRCRLSNYPDPQSLFFLENRCGPGSLLGEGRLEQRWPEFALTSSGSGKNALVNGAKSRDRPAESSSRPFARSRPKHDRIGWSRNGAVREPSDSPATRSLRISATSVCYARGTILRAAPQNPRTA
jgi:hypothetical protein